MNNSDDQAGKLRARVRKAAHDVRTPLTSIAGFAQLLLEDGTLSPGARENAETVLEEAKRLSEMLESFFDEVTETLDAEAPTTNEL
jgi:two-component system OmpR family sensor kinase